MPACAISAAVRQHGQVPVCLSFTGNGGGTQPGQKACVGSWQASTRCQSGTWQQRWMSETADTKPVCCALPPPACISDRGLQDACPRTHCHAWSPRDAAEGGSERRGWRHLGQLSTRFSMLGLHPKLPPTWQRCHMAQQFLTCGRAGALPDHGSGNTHRRKGG